MKKLMTLIVVALFATATFAQDNKMDAKPAAKPAEAKAKHECYMMKGTAVVHCMGDKTEPQKADVTLKNGTKVSPDGTVTTKDGNKSKLSDGQCISMMGSIGDCEKMHSSMKDDKMKPAAK